MQVVRRTGVPFVWLISSKLKTKYHRSTALCLNLVENILDVGIWEGSTS